MNRKEKKILNSFIKEATRAIMQSPESYSKSYEDKAGQVQKDLTSRGIKQNDRTSETDIEVILEEIANAIGPNTYIRFENQYGRKSPKFSISPIVKYDTPHGIYAYPLDKENFISLIEDKSPTDAEFATDYSHFHIFKTDMTKTEIMSQKESEIETKYKTSKSAKKDILEAFRSFSMLIEYNKKDKKLIESEDKKNKLVQKIIGLVDSAKSEFINYKFTNVIDHDFPTTIREIVEENNYFIKNKSGSIVSIFAERQIINKFADLLHSVCCTIYSSEVYTKRISKKVIFFRAVKKSIEILSSVLGKINNTRRGQYYSLLLHIVGIDGIKDKGTGLIHRNEPTQFVSHDFDGSNLKVVGTYKNIFKNIRSNELYEKLINVASKPENKSSLGWVWNTKRAYKKNYSVGQGNVPESEILKVIDKQKNISAFLAIAICKELNATSKIHLTVLDKVNTEDNPEARSKILDAIVDNVYTEDEVLRHILDNENPDYKHKEKIAKHKNASKETKEIAESFGNTVKKYVGKIKSFF